MSVAKVVIEILANTSDSEKKLEGLAKKLNLVLGAGFLVGMTKRAIDTADAMGKAAQRSGIAVEAFSRLAYSAKIGDVELGEFELGIKEFNQSIAEAASGNEKANRTFKAMGVEVKNSDGSLRGTEEILLDVADAFSGYRDGAAKTALANALFGRSSQRLIPWLNEGKAKIKEMGEEAKRTGNQISEEAAKGADEFKDSVTRLNGTVSGFFLQVAEKVIPTLNSLVGNLDELGTKSEFAKAGVTFLSAAAKALAVSLAIAESTILKIGKALGVHAAAAVELLKGNLTNAGKMLNDFDKEALEMDEALKVKLANILDPQKQQKKKEDEDKDKNKDAPLIANENAAKKEISLLDEVNRAWLEASQQREQLLMEDLINQLRAAEQTLTNQEELSAAKMLIEKTYAARLKALHDENAEQARQAVAKTIEQMDATAAAGLARQMDILQARRIGIEGNAEMSEAQQKRELIALLHEENRLLEGQANSHSKIQKNKREIADLESGDFFGTTRKNMKRMGDEFTAVGKNIANVLDSGIRQSVDGIGDSIMGAIDRTRTWGQVYADVGRNVVRSLIQVGAQMVANFLLTKALQLAARIEAATTGTTIFASMLPGAVVAGAATSGVSTAAGIAITVAAMGAAIAAGMGGFARGGLVDGPGTTTSDSIMARLSRNEFVIPANRVSEFGPGFFEAIRTGALRASDMATNAGRSVPMPITSNPGFSSRSSAVNVTATPAAVNVAVIDNEQKARRFALSNEGRQLHYDMARRRQHEFGPT